MESACANLTGAVRLVQLLKIEGFRGEVRLPLFLPDFIKSTWRWSVGGYEWEIRIYPAKMMSTDLWLILELNLLSEPRVCRASLAGRLVDPSGKLEPSEEKSAFYRPEESKNYLWLMRTGDLRTSGYLRDGTLTVQGAITVLKELPEPAIPGKEVTEPSHTLNQHLGDLLQSGTGADVTFLVSGESFAVHKNILAARSPVFMAEFFGDMKEKCSQSLKIDDMEAEVFKALLCFIYTDIVPEFENQEDVTLMAQHLFAAADRYGLDMLKLICSDKLSNGISINTVATTLALAEQHRSLQLKAKCVDFIISTPTILDAVLATDGYKHLASSCPSVVTDLLKAACSRKI
ncbi:hypothetical protein CFC21_111089 [Triticum aestivum]|uniref:BTB domain-containing protein n=2 Tax=Triticum aestivum TaxID=4565 RepID=A0A9R1MPZ9_WHEAT|nr:BTB/POZ and MATH domain-containing protein 1-like [Triticum aestivum]KAF7111037.1 hypothetical protein CFC21_111087 [Triticum aestivum]KAF7111038.1 hypothetical protein CFC21_111088 [Triticum aestivum]KAF7111039.1 hypothetical protein CFC21_111089 [Triticum aestivum]